VDKTFEVELAQVSESNAYRCVAHIERQEDVVALSIITGSAYYVWRLLPSEAVTIGEQLIAAGRAEAGA